MDEIPETRSFTEPSGNDVNDANDHTLTFQCVYSGIGLASELVLSPARRKSFQKNTKNRNTRYGRKSRADRNVVKLRKNGKHASHDDRNVVKLWNDSAAALSRLPAGSWKDCVCFPSKV
jgi:hypothetical protein